MFSALTERLLEFVELAGSVARERERPDEIAQSGRGGRGHGTHVLQKRAVEVRQRVQLDRRLFRRTGLWVLWLYISPIELEPVGRF